MKDDHRPQARTPDQPATAKSAAHDDSDDDDDAVVGADFAVTVTFFPSYAAKTKTEAHLSITELARRIEATSCAEKARLPWLKLARFGDQRTAEGSLRSNENVLTFTGIEADYDGEIVALQAAIDLLRKHGILAIVYASPSYTEDTPRWRVLCFFSRELPPDQRARMLARVAGLFAEIGVTFSNESWTLSQSYYFGSVKRNPSHRAVLLEGTPIDLMDHLDATAIGKPTLGKPNGAGDQRRGPASRVDDITDARIRGLVDSLLDHVRNAPDGQKHPTLLRIGHTLGGYLHVIGWSQEEAVEALVTALPASVKDWDAARKTAAYAVASGARQPLELEDRPQRWTGKASPPERPAGDQPNGQDAHRRPDDAGDEYSRLAEALEYVEGADDPDTRILVGVALHGWGNGSAAARDLWDSWCRSWRQYSASSVLQMWQSFGHHPGPRCGIATIFDRARQNGWPEADAAEQQNREQRGDEDRDSGNGSDQRAEAAAEDTSPPPGAQDDPDYAANPKEEARQGPEPESSSGYRDGPDYKEEARQGPEPEPPPNAPQYEGPRPLRRELPPAPHFPREALGPLRKAAEAIEQRIQAPFAIAAQSVLAAATLAVQQHRDVELPGAGRRPLTGLLTSDAESGDRKTSCDLLALRAVRRYENELREEHIDETARHAADLGAWKAACEHIKKIHKGNRAAIREALLANGPEPKPPPHPMVLVADPTPEALILHLQNGHPSAGLFTEEGGILIGGHAMNDDNRMRTGALLNTLWDGSPIRRLRVGTGASFLPGRRCSAHIMMQPLVSAVFFGDVTLAGIGTLSRTLPVAPDTIAGTRLYREADRVGDVVLAEYDTRLSELLRLPPRTTPEDESVLDPVPLIMTPDARAYWIKFHDRVERRLAPNSELAGLRAFGSKLAEHAGRLAAVLAVYEDPETIEVSIEHILWGTQLAEHYACEVSRLSEAAQVDPELRLAQRLLAWWQAREDPVCDLVMIYQRGPRPIRDAATARRIVTILVEHGWLLRLPRGTVVDGMPRREVWALRR